MFPLQAAADPALVVVLALALAAVHALGAHLHVSAVLSHRQWVSVAGGVSVAYVFAHAIPVVARGRHAVAAHDGLPLGEHFVYVVALLGFVAYYGVERLASRGRADGGPLGRPDGVFWTHLAAFVAYNGVVGYLLADRPEAGLSGLLLFALAMALHLFVIDYGLRDHHGAVYHRVGRWALAGAVVAGATVGVVARVPEAAVAATFAFLAGGTVLNVVKEELPDEREGLFVPFAAGAAGYTLLLLVAPT